MRDQLATQLLLAIASGELSAGKRLPSTRALAKRLKLNVNTVSAAYQQLDEAGWVASIRGSGVYVKARQMEPGLAGDALDRLMLPFVEAARLSGFSANMVRERIDQWFSIRPWRFVFVHSEPELRAIIVQELQPALSWPVEACEAEAASVNPYVGNSIFVTVPSKQDKVRRLFPSAAEVLALEMRQVDQALARYLPICPEVLLVVASAWSGFLQIAHTVLTAAGCHPDAVLFHDTRVGPLTQDSGARHLDSASAVVCDVVTAALLPDSVRRVVFHLVSDDGIDALKSFERFFAELGQF